MLAAGCVKCSCRGAARTLAGKASCMKTSSWRELKFCIHPLHGNDQTFQIFMIACVVHNGAACGDVHVINIS